MKRRRLNCPECHLGGYVQGVAIDGRPKFTCTRCNYWWTCGKDGGPYCRFADKKENGKAAVIALRRQGSGA